MRVLTVNEVNQVSGGNPLNGAIVGAAVGGLPGAVVGLAVGAAIGYAAYKASDSSESS